MGGLCVVPSSTTCGSNGQARASGDQFEPGLVRVRESYSSDRRDFTFRPMPEVS